jgi:putative transposase
MLIHKAFRYRVYPTPEQEARLLRWESALRFLWNIALEQRNMGIARTDKVYPSAFDQQKEMTDLRRELPWLADVPRNVCAQLLAELDKAFERCFSRLGKIPRWKRKDVDVLGLCEPHPNAWRLDGANIRFPKLGILRTTMHRAISGTPKTCTLRREGDQWFASLVCRVEAADPPKRIGPVIAFDRGLNALLADSDGNLTTNPKHYDKALKRLAHAQRAVSRKKKGSKNREKSKLRVMRIHRKVRRQREHFLHVLSSTIAKSNGVVVIEKLYVANMVRMRPLARGIADAGWSQFARMLGYKLAWSGGTLVEVPAQYSSQTCSECGVVDASSRNSERFNCTSCGHTDHADLNAAKVLKQRYETPGNPWCLPVDGIALEAPGRSRKAKVKLRTSRRDRTKCVSSAGH